MNATFPLLSAYARIPENAANHIQLATSGPSDLHARRVRSSPAHGMYCKIAKALVTIATVEQLYTRYPSTSKV